MLKKIDSRKNPGKIRNSFGWKSSRSENRDLKFDKDSDRDRDRNFRDPGHALPKGHNVHYAKDL